MTEQHNTEPLRPDSVCLPDGSIVNLTESQTTDNAFDHFAEAYDRNVTRTYKALFSLSLIGGGVGLGLNEAALTTSSLIVAPIAALGIHRSKIHQLLQRIDN
jgi:hypothetical protein